jgi:hypothetical protein
MPKITSAAIIGKRINGKNIIYIGSKVMYNLQTGKITQWL